MAVEVDPSAKLSSSTLAMLAFIPISNSLIDIGRFLLIKHFGSPIFVSTIKSATQATLLLCLSIYLGQEARLNPLVWLSFFSNWLIAAIWVLSSCLYLQAIRQTGLGETIAYLALTPLWIRLSAVVWLDQSIVQDMEHFAGLGLIFTGLIIQTRGGRRLDNTLHQQTKRDGRIKMIAVSVLWSVITALDRGALSRHHSIEHTCMVQILACAYGILLLELHRRFQSEILLGASLRQLLFESVSSPKAGKLDHYNLDGIFT